MTLRHGVVLMALGGLASIAGLGAQTPPVPQAAAVKNPRLGDPAAITSGMTLFRAQCSECHGLDAKGIRGPDLTAVLAAGASDARLLQTVKRGVPGTEMPSSPSGDNDVWAILAYVQSLNVAAPAATTGDAAKGEQVFWGAGGCGSCHRVGVRGGRLGPDLSRIGSMRSRQGLTREIRKPGEFSPNGYSPVTIVMRNGERIRGVAKNEDAFSIQIMDTQERLRNFLKDQIANIVREKQSLMPEFGAARLSDADLDDLLAFLSRLRAAPPSGARGGGGDA